MFKFDVVKIAVTTIPRKSFFTFPEIIFANRHKQAANADFVKNFFSRHKMS